MRSEWIDCKQEMPPDAIAVLVWCPERRNKYTATWRAGYWSHFGGYGHCQVEEEVTYWMPTPAPPHEGEDEKC